MPSSATTKRPCPVTPSTILLALSMATALQLPLVIQALATWNIDSREVTVCGVSIHCQLYSKGNHAPLFPATRRAFVMPINVQRLFRSTVRGGLSLCIHSMIKVERIQVCGEHMKAQRRRKGALRLEIETRGVSHGTVLTIRATSRNKPV